jgi:hypothetical protein
LGCLAVGALFVVISLLRMLVDRMRASTDAA